MGDVYGLYDVREPDRIRYVGLTEFTAAERLRGHWKQAIYTSRKLPIIFWMKKRTKDQIQFRIFLRSDDVEELKSTERQLIAEHRESGQADLNVTDGGETATGYVHTQAFRQWQSEKNSGAGNPFYGKTHTAETRALIAEANKRKMDRPGFRTHFANKVGKLNSVDVPTIRWVLQSGLLDMRQIATSYGVSYGTIWNLARRKTWTHVQ